MADLFKATTSRRRGVIYQDANVKVTAVENTHSSSRRTPPYGKYKSFSYPL